MLKRAIMLLILCGSLIFLLGGLAWGQGQPQVPSDQLPPEGEQPQTASGQIYFYQNDQLTAVSRDIAGGSQTAEFAMIELLKGPSDQEKAQGFVTYIPDGVKLQYSTIKQDHSEYSVCLSNELLGLSDPTTSEKALAQIEKTLQDVTGISTIGITVAGTDMGGTPRDAYEALGVTRGSAAGGASSSSSVWGWLLPVIIVLVVLAAGLPLFFLAYLPRRREKLATISTRESREAAKRLNKRTKK
jgi:hypothetical protein